jgi:hypothetical protein
MGSNTYRRKLGLDRVSSPTFNDFLNNKLKPKKNEDTTIKSGIKQ